MSHRTRRRSGDMAIQGLGYLVSPTGEVAGPCREAPRNELGAPLVATARRNRGEGIRSSRLHEGGPNKGRDPASAVIWPGRAREALLRVCKTEAAQVAACCGLGRFAFMGAWKMGAPPPVQSE